MSRQGESASGRWAVLLKYARLTRSGKPMRCPRRNTWTRPDGSKGASHHGGGPIIYDTREQAEAANVELELLGSRTCVAYPCPVSEHGHHHLKPARTRAGKDT